PQGPTRGGCRWLLLASSVPGGTRRRGGGDGHGPSTRRAPDHRLRHVPGPARRVSRLHRDRAAVARRSRGPAWAVGPAPGPSGAGGGRPPRRERPRRRRDGDQGPRTARALVGGRGGGRRLSPPAG